MAGEEVGIMNFLHSRVELGTGNSVVVKLQGTEANVMVMSDHDFRCYQSGERFAYYGGHYRRSPAIIKPPTSGTWNVVVDLGGFAGEVQASMYVI